MQNIYDLSQADLEQYFISIGDKPFRAVQILEWLYRHKVTSFDEMTNLSKKAIIALKENFVIEHLNLKTKYVSKDGTVKYLFELKDGNLIETVLMRHNYGNSVCVTSEVGCNMGCSFCASGELGCIRKLTLSEMVLQVLYVDNELNKENERVSNIVVMGIGEPFDNYETLLKFLRTVNYAKGLEIGARHITVSTSGIVPKIYEFAKFPLQINLAISLHAATNELRSKIMKINKVYPIEEIMKAIDYYLEKTNRRVTFEYILLKGVNDSYEDAMNLVKLVRGVNCYINLIPYNEVPTNSYKSTSHDDAERFFEILSKNGINATLRMEHGNDVAAACGQLRAQTMKKEDKKC
ncbi:MAG: 23S rRNA (adenine(2503)-C(2))-methyltransferase RlmN [Bacilli bacterium]|nr:23S rRNA (adenine(2503)-C(2))-methyltransferase RlmN [Bacilli bacterium]